MDVDDSEGEIHLQYFKLDRNVYATTCIWIFFKSCNQWLFLILPLSIIL